MLSPISNVFLVIIFILATHADDFDINP